MGALPNNEIAQPAISVEDRLRLVINTIPCLILRATPVGAFDFINHQWLEFTGLKMENVKGQGWHSALHPEDVEKALSIWHAGLAAGKPFEHEARVRRFDGEYRWFLIRNVLDCSATTHGVIFAEYVAQVTKEQGSICCRTCLADPPFSYQGSRRAVRRSHVTRSW